MPMGILSSKMGSWSLASSLLLLLLYYVIVVKVITGRERIK
jgi:hypothetical protein